MDAERYQQVKAVLDAALELEPEERPAFLDEKCANDPELRVAVEALLAAHDRAQSFLEHPGGADGTTVTVKGPDGTPERIGPYKILEQLGEGGMGVVYLAEQVEPIRRRVALKLIKLGMDSKQVVARFEAERQALALMDHPSVAKVFDAGATDEGRPYFVMEFVKGVPITKYCDQNRLSNKDRLALFIQVCEAIQHAHQKGIIHRDIKPTNVLVTLQDEKPVPKVIDFGVAKATSQQLTERTLFTQHGILVGTPEYMSPEQAGTTGLDLDTRTDVYSLGVLLYELLVGALPFEPKRLRKAAALEMQRIIHEEEPPKPSKRISTLGEVASSSAAQRRTDPTRLRKQVAGDLDWITMRALEKDRRRRYGSPNELATDINRHLEDEPVLAGPPSAAYRMGKFLKRHSVGSTFAATLIVLLIGAGIGMSVLYTRAVLAEARSRKVAEATQQAMDFLAGMFEISDPSEARGNTITARELLDKGAEDIEDTLADQPEAQARLMLAVAEAYRRLGLKAQAEPLYLESLEISKRVLGDDHPDTLFFMSVLAHLYREQGRYDEAEPLFLEILEIRQHVLGDDHPDTLGTMYQLAWVYRKQGRDDEAEPLCLEILEHRKRALGDDHPGTLGTMYQLAWVYRKQGRYDESESLYLEVLEISKRVLGDDHPDTLGTMNDLALLYQSQRRYAEAEPLYLETLEISKRALGNDHPFTLDPMNNLAVLYDDQGRYDEAELLYSEVLEIRKRVLGDEHEDTIRSMNNLTAVRENQHLYGENESRYEGED